jgi:hypothetical protein
MFKDREKLGEELQIDWKSFAFGAQKYRRKVGN